jgi:alkylation response protein AidB-like acyl-CoA dehydrogenase
VESERQFDFLREWQRKVFDAGYLGLDWPAEYGGKGDPLKRQRIVSQELNRAGAPFLVNVIGLQWAGPTILAVGNEEQKKRFLKPILSAEEIWCQGFSEPGAGSDLASLTATAEPTDDGWLVTGHRLDDARAFREVDDPAGANRSSGPQYAGISYCLFRWTRRRTVQPLVKMSGEAASTR